MLLKFWFIFIRVNLWNKLQIKHFIIVLNEILIKLKKNDQNGNPNFFNCYPYLWHIFDFQKWKTWLFLFLELNPHFKYDYYIWNNTYQFWLKSFLHAFLKLLTSMLLKSFQHAEKIKMLRTIIFKNFSKFLSETKNLIYNNFSFSPLQICDNLFFQ